MGLVWGTACSMNGIIMERIRRKFCKIWKGGLASHGGVFALILALIWYSKTDDVKKAVWWLFDRMIPAVAVVCMCIRFGNLMNSEIFGYPTQPYHGGI